MWDTTKFFFLFDEGLLGLGSMQIQMCMPRRYLKLMPMTCNDIQTRLVVGGCVTQLDYLISNHFECHVQHKL